ncbi:MAG: hypothetical protein ACH350_04750 [Parachlamydiaceae bacterium]
MINLNMMLHVIGWIKIDLKLATIDRPDILLMAERGLGMDQPLVIL